MDKPDPGIEGDWPALGEAVKVRRKNLHLKQEELVACGGPSAKTISAIEDGQAGTYRPSTFSKLDRALRWPAGTAEAILRDTARPQKPGGDVPGALGKAVARRRLQLGLTQTELAQRGGPSTETLRLIENGLQDSYGPRTMARLEGVLRWPSGTGEALLRGVVSEQEVIENGCPAAESVTKELPDERALRVGRAALVLMEEFWAARPDLNQTVPDET